MAHKLSQPDAGAEHEAFLRAPFSGAVQFSVGANPTPALGEGRELSVGGLFLESDEVLSPGTRARLHFEVATRPIDVTGEVVRVVKGGVLHAAGMGWRFVDLNADDSRTVIEYVISRR
jgi:hypothetical protein